MLQIRYLFVVLALCVGALGGGLLAWSLAQSGGLSRGEVTSPSALGETRALEDRLLAVERGLQSLTRRIAAREALAAHARKMVPESDEPGSAAGDPTVHPDDATFELAVRAVMDRVEVEQRQEREARRKLRREERARGLADLLAEELQLSTSQRPEVERILAEQSTRYRELKQKAADAPDGGAVTPRQKKAQKSRLRQQVAEETDAKLREVLDERQLRTFRELQEEEDIGPGG
jgi:hypothetical protein